MLGFVVVIIYQSGYFGTSWVPLLTLFAGVDCQKVCHSGYVSVVMSHVT